MEEDQLEKINKQFIDNQKVLNKPFYFSHEPWVAKSHEFLSKEAEYLIDLGAKDFKTGGIYTYGEFVKSFPNLCK